MIHFTFPVKMLPQTGTPDVFSHYSSAAWEWTCHLYLCCWGLRQENSFFLSLMHLGGPYCWCSPFYFTNQLRPAATVVFIQALKYDPDCDLIKLSTGWTGSQEYTWESQSSHLLKSISQLLFSHFYPWRLCPGNCQGSLRFFIQKFLSWVG